MIYVCTHKEPAYKLEGSITIDNTRSPLPEEYGHIRVIEIVSKMSNLPEEVGIFQQRRRLFHTSIPAGYECVVPHNFCVCKIRDQYAACHGIEMLDIVEETINDDLFSIYIRIERNYECYWDNMLILKRDAFLEYAKFLLDALEKKDKIAGPFQNRWLAERIGSFWIWKNIKLEKILVSNRIQID